MATNTYVVLDTKTLVSAVSSVTFSPIPQGYTDLILVASGTATAGNVNANLRFNGDSSALYSDTYMSGTGSAAQSSRHSNQTFMYLQGYGWWDQSQGNDIVHIMNYSNTTTFKTVLSRANFSNNGVSATVGLYRSTNAITSIEFRADSSTFTAGSTFTIYGVTAAAPFAAKATGGTITYSVDGYAYHTFTSGGTFTPSVALSCDVLVIGGGGGGGNGGSYSGGGGSAGTVTYASSQNISSAQTVTIGGPGSGGYAGGAGTTSSFGGTSASGGSGGATGSTSGGIGAGGSNSGANGGPGTGAYSSLASLTNSGVNGFYAGGGGAASFGAGGSGGGGAGSGTGTGSAGVSNTGSGGGGGGFTGGPGGSGIVIVRYAI